MVPGSRFVQVPGSNREKIAPIVAYNIHVKNSTNSSIPDSRFIQVHATCSRIQHTRICYLFQYTAYMYMLPVPGSNRSKNSYLFSTWFQVQIEK